jgi:hypothetical protein
MTEHIVLIARKLEHLGRMRVYLAYSQDQVARIAPINWSTLTPEQHESLAAFRVRFSDFQEQLGKTMRAVAIEEEQPTEPFTSVLLYMEKLAIIESKDRWKEMRELRNAINHEYEENTARLTAFFEELASATPQLLVWHDNLVRFCKVTYGVFA